MQRNSLFRESLGDTLYMQNVTLPIARETCIAKKWSYFFCVQKVWSFLQCLRLTLGSILLRCQTKPYAGISVAVSVEENFFVTDCSLNIQVITKVRALVDSRLDNRYGRNDFLTMNGLALDAGAIEPRNLFTGRTRPSGYRFMRLPFTSVFARVSFSGGEWYWRMFFMVVLVALFRERGSAGKSKNKGLLLLNRS